MFTKFPKLGLSAPLPLTEKQPNSNQSASSATTAGVSEKISSNGPGRIESGVNNLRRFALRFNHKESAAPASTRTNGKSGPISQISIPKIGSNTAYRKIDEPSPGERNDRIEKFALDRKQNLNSETVVNWDDYLKATEGSGLHADIAALKDRLTQIDQKVARSIDELRLTAYEDIRNANRHLTPQYELDAKNSTKRTFKERLSVGGHRANMKAQRLAERKSMVEKQKALDVKSAISRFEQRVTDDFEANRVKDIRSACVDLLRKHVEGRVPAGLLEQLVREISPNAIDRFTEEQSAVFKDFPLLASFAIPPKPDDASGR